MSSDMNRRIRVATTDGRKIRRAAIALVALTLAAGCQPMVRPAAQAPEPPATQLLDAARLDLPTDCAVLSGRSYRMSYTVGLDGRTGNLGAITPPDAPRCLQAALAAWVASFRYAPVAQTETLTADWMLVTARRGS
jgi:hypothetical protein